MVLRIIPCVFELSVFKKKYNCISISLRRRMVRPIFLDEQKDKIDNLGNDWLKIDPLVPIISLDPKWNFGVTF